MVWGPEWCQRKPAKTDHLNKIQCLIIRKCPGFNEKNRSSYQVPGISLTQWNKTIKAVTRMRNWLKLSDKDLKAAYVPRRATKSYTSDTLSNTIDKSQNNSLKRTEKWKTEKWEMEQTESKK